MRKKLSRLTPVVVSLVLMLTAIAWLAVGCENGGSGNSLTIDPANSMIGRNIAQLTLTIAGGLRDLSLPVEWSVTNPELGHIEHTGGPVAVYTRTALTGLQIISVRDQYGVEGIAAVDQISQDTADPGTTTATAADTPTTGTTNAAGAIVRF